MISLLKFLDGPWDRVKGYLISDLETIEATLNQRWAQTFGDSNTLQSSVIGGDATQVSRSVCNTGTDNTPTWDQVSLSTGVSGTLSVSKGGTGTTTETNHGVLLGRGTSAIGALAVGVSNTVLHGVTGADPSFSAVSLTADVTGILPVTKGGTGADLSATGGTSKVLRQSSAGAVVTVSTLASTELSDTSTLTHVMGSGRADAQIALVASVATYTVGAADGSFLISANVLVTTSTVHNFSVTCAYTDESNVSRTLTLSFSQLAGSSIQAITNVTGVGPYEGFPLYIRCKAGTAITLATAGTFTTVVYNVDGAIVQVR